MSRSIRIAAAVVALLAGLLPGGLLPVAALAPAARAAVGLPALPSAWPWSHLELGLADSPNGAHALRQSTSLTLRYQYLCGGVNTGTGWATWNANAQFADFYVQESAANGFTPVFIYYQVLQSNPGWADFTAGRISEGQADMNNLANAATMRSYFGDARLLFQRLHAYATPIVVDLEPDLWGYIQQRATGDDGTTVPVAVASSGDADVAGLPNDAAGFARALVALRDKYAPNVMLGYELSEWGTMTDPIRQNSTLTQIDALATRSANFEKSLGAGFDLVFTDPNDRDAAFDQIIYGDGGASWWDAADYDRFNRYVAGFVAGTGKRMVLWQVPLGNTKMRAMNNTWGHYQDNHVEWWFGDGASANLAATVNAGVIAVLYGGGADGTTAATDAMGDGVTNPAAINGNTTLSYSADDDGGYFRHQAAAYYAAGAAALPSPTPANLVRYAGPDRFATAASISSHTFAAGCDCVAYIANAYDFPDALAGAAAAGTVKGPILLVAATGPVNASTDAELKRLAPKRIVVLGGTSAVGPDVFAAVASYVGGTANVARYGGADRFGTAAIVSRNTFAADCGCVAYVANAYNFPDALAGAAAAGTVNGPLLLVAASGPVDPATDTELRRLAPARIVVLGGTSAVGTDVAAALATYVGGSPNVARYSGSNRFATAASVSSHTFSAGCGCVAYIANAYAFPDALAAAAAAGTVKGPVLLVAATGAIDPATAAELTRLAPSKIVVVGGTAAVSLGVFDSLAFVPVALTAVEAVATDQSRRRW